MKFGSGPFVAYARSITPDKETGIGRWTDQQLGKAIREGIHSDDTVIRSPMSIGLYLRISDADLKAIVAYVRAQKLEKNQVAKFDYKMPLPPNNGSFGHCIECHTSTVE